MIETIIKCNFCGVKSCTSYNSEISKGCRMFVELDDFHTPMLVHLMDGYKAVNTTKVLEKFGFSVQEIGQYPFFRLHLRG